MATDFWASSHFKRWIVDRATLHRARLEDLHYVDDPDHLALLGIFFANLMSKLGNKLSMRQRVIATATIFFRRFYIKNSYCETDPYLVLAACCYVAAKAEESPVHIKTVISEARSVFGVSQHIAEYNVRHFPTENSKLAEMEFYLVDDLECDLLVFHPYRTLMALVKDASQAEQSLEEKEAGELGAGIDDGPRYWGTGEGKLDMHTGGIQNAWFLINDTYRSDICLVYPPHLIAIAALYLVCVLNPFVRQAHLDWTELKQAALVAAQHQPGATTRRSARHANSVVPQKRTASSDSNTDDGATRKPIVPPQDFVGFFASLNVNLRVVATIAQEMISFYALCDRLKEDFNPISSSTQKTGSNSASGSRNSRKSAGRISVDDASRSATGYDVDSNFLVQLLNRMRAMKESDVAHPASGRPTAVNRLLERTQGAG
ncbi:cyclin-like protein [Fomitiporia mediterranea MF3/22]|uniref:cyclin-like protein n=1 Tax=Fomitiporia mediterranea (strain MF3/22) TaxID=694068 RepID=UPI00044083B4|nr:cyclin-like protein [Fomitiporia mediterranea MF3/22]EJD05692.1 cyclin-like protein [Fomitiporia mediterranea MF3/22]